MAGFMKYLKLLIPATIFLAIYTVYKDRGLQAIADDMRALFSKIQANPGMIVGILTGLIVPAAILIFAPGLVKKYMPKGSWLVYVVIAALTYFAVSEIAVAVQQNAMGAGAGGTPPAMTQRPRTMMYGRGGRTA